MSIGAVEICLVFCRSFLKNAKKLLLLLYLKLYSSSQGSTRGLPEALYLLLLLRSERRTADVAKVLWVGKAKKSSGAKKMCNAKITQCTLSEVH